MNPLRVCWTVVLVGGLITIKAAAFMSYQGMPAPPPPVAILSGPVMTRTVEPPPEGKTEDPMPAEYSPKGRKDYQKHLSAGQRAFADDRLQDAKNAFLLALKAHQGEEAKSWLERTEAKIALRKKEVDAKVQTGIAELIQKRVHAALRFFEEALKLSSDDIEALAARDEAREILKRFAIHLDAGKKASEGKDFKKAVDFFQLAVALVADDDEGRRLLEEARKAQMPPKPRLTGSVLVLVLHTRKSSLGRPSFHEQLASLEKEYGDKTLLGKKVQVLTAKGIEPWSPEWKLEEELALDNHAFDDLFTRAFDGIKKLGEQAVNKDFQVILIWETNFNPDGAAGREIKRPTDRKYSLCYRFTDRDSESKKLAEWLGKDDVARYKAINELKNFVEDFLPPKK